MLCITRKVLYDNASEGWTDTRSFFLLQELEKYNNNSLENYKKIIYCV